MMDLRSSDRSQEWWTSGSGQIWGTGLDLRLMQKFLEMPMQQWWAYEFSVMRI